MRLQKFLNEGIIKVNLSGIENLLDTIEKQCMFKSDQTIMNYLNKSFSKYYVAFEKTHRRQASDDGMAEVGLNYAETSMKAPFGITAYLDDLSIFGDPEYFYLGKDAIFRILRHEFLHREQFVRASANKRKPFTNGKDYLGNPQEIMALAYDTYLQLLIQGLGPADVEKLKDFSNLEEFLRTFKKGSPERNRFMKYLSDYFAK